jgi:DNA-binding NtrC family response regulator
MSYDEVATNLRRGGSDGEATDFELRVTAGPDAGKVVVVDATATGGPLLAGKSATCALQLGDDEVSRRHASFEPDGATLRLEDLGSTNGTFVNGVRVYAAALLGGESVQLGSTVVRVTPRRATALASTATSFGPVLGASGAMRRMYSACERVALARVPAVIEGATGTGKELVAEAIHRMSPRRGGPFVVFDCSAAVPGDTERALFGTEGNKDDRGVFEQASGGTLLLDEIADLSLDAQGKLLRAIERGEVRRVGGASPIAVDVRVLATTQHDLDAAIEAGRFREDLYFRLAVARIAVPPLDKRREDIPMLVRHFWWAQKGPGDPPPELVARFEARAWPGNVRELANAVTRALLLDESAHGEAPSLDPDDAVFDRILAENLPLPRAREKLVDAFERAYVARILAEHGGNVARAAAASGLALRYFQVLRARQAKTPRDE